MRSTPNLRSEASHSRLIESGLSIRRGAAIGLSGSQINPHLVKTIGRRDGGPFAQQAADYLFGMTEAVHRGRIDPIHPELQGVTHRGQRNGVVLGSPAECPAAAADRPGAKSGFGDQDAARAEGSLRKVHCSILRLKTALTVVAKRLIHEGNIIALTAVKLRLRLQTSRSNRTSVP
jgi:hypothetical protein